MDQEKKRRLLISVCVIVGIFIMLILLIILLRSCEQKRIQEAIENFESDTYYLDPEVGYAEIIDINEIGPAEINTSDIATENCQPQAQLFIKNISITDTGELKPVSYTLVLKPYVLPAELTANPQSSGIEVLTPEANQELVAGSTFLLQWNIDSGRQFTVDILFSSDGGQTYLEVKKGINNQNEIEILVPDADSQNCLFRINVWVGTAFLGYNQSDTFSVSSPMADSAESDQQSEEESQTQTDNSA